MILERYFEYYTQKLNVLLEFQQVVLQQASLLSAALLKKGCTANMTCIAILMIL